MNITTYEMNKILNHVFGGKTTASLVYTSGSFFLGLSTTDISSDGSGATEPSSAYNYSRAPMRPIDWSEAVSGSVVNLASGSFKSETGAWGTIHSVFLCNKQDTTDTIPSSASVCYYYNLPTPFPVPVNTTVTFSAGSIVVSIA